MVRVKVTSRQDTHHFLWGEELHKVVWEDTNIAIEFSLPPALIFQLLAQHCDDVSLLQFQLVLVFINIGKDDPRQLPHWQNKREKMLDKTMSLETLYE